jgi:erythromycin esterase-like protein
LGREESAIDDGKESARFGAAPYDGLSRCAEVETSFRRTRLIPEAATAACDGAAHAVAVHFQRDAAALTRRAGKSGFAWAKLRLTGLQGWLEEMVYYNSDFGRSRRARDRAMAALFQGIRALRYPKAKVALWAHNRHITRDPAAVAFGVNMGAILAAELRGRYAIVGLVSHEASIDWPGAGCGPVDPPPSPGSVETILHDLGEDTLLVDLRFPGTRDPHLAPGRLYELNDTLLVPATAFDLLVFLDRSPKMTPLAWPPCSWRAARPARGSIANVLVREDRPWRGVRITRWTQARSTTARGAAVVRQSQ